MARLPIAAPAGLPYKAPDMSSWTDAEVRADYNFWSGLLAAHPSVDIVLRAYVDFQAEAESELKRRGIFDGPSA